MKVLFATYPMAFHTPGGGEIQLLAYQKHLPAYGIDVSLFDPWNPRFLDHDVVHFFSCMGGSVHFCRFVKQLGLPLVVSSSLWITHETKHLYPIDEIRSQLDLADKVVANSDIECDTLSEVLDIPRGKFSTVYNGVEDVFFLDSNGDDFRRHLNIRDPFILNVGNIEPRKNQLMLARAMKGFPEYKLVLIGHIRDVDYFQHVLEIGGEQIIYIGALTHESSLLRSAFHASSVFALPSTLETPGLAALEAAGMGIRLLVTEEGSAREYFSDAAIYINPGNLDSIRMGIARSLSEESAYTRKELQETIRQDFRWSGTTQKLKKIYESLLIK